MVDRTECWVVGQSFNGMAIKSPPYISKLHADATDQKLAAHLALWDDAAQSAISPSR